MSRREKARRARLAEFWRWRLANAHDAAAVCNVAYDHLRAVIRHLPEAEKEQAWRQVSAALSTFRRTVEVRLGTVRREFRSRPTHPDGAATPRRAPARARVTGPGQERQR